VVLAVPWCFAQAQQQSTPSLGEIARQLRAERARTTTRPVKVFTNDNLTVERRAEAERAPAPKAEAPTAPSGAQQAAGPATTTTVVHDEKYFRSEMAKLRSKLDRQQRELEVLQQKLAQNQMQYYPDPNDTLLQEFTRDDINKKLAEIEQKQQVAETERAIEELHNQLRREGGHPGWLRD